MIKAPVRKNAKLRFWLWPVRLIGKFWKSPVSPGLWLVNKFCQNVLDINNDIPWMVHFTSRVTGEITIGENVWISFAVSGGCYIQGINGIIIGDNTVFAPGVKIISSNHDHQDLDKFIPKEEIKIGRNCWIGANAIILPGVKLGDHVVIGAGSVVTQDIPYHSIAAGNPAKIIRTIL